MPIKFTVKITFIPEYSNVRFGFVRRQLVEVCRVIWQRILSDFVLPKQYQSGQSTLEQIDRGNGLDQKQSDFYFQFDFDLFEDFDVAKNKGLYYKQQG